MPTLPTRLPSARLLPDTTTLSSDGVMHIAGHSLIELAQCYGTPLYIFDRATIVNACQQYQRAFQQDYQASPVRIIYASKAYLSPLVAQIMAEQGIGLDVVSGGELYVAQHAGFPMENVSFHGNNKTEDELRLALRLSVGRIVLDNWNELERLTRIAQETKETPHVLQRGQLHLAGLHAHTGTMLRETRPYEECLERLLTLAAEIYEETGWWPEEVSPGGGWGIDTSDVTDVPSVSILAQALQNVMERRLAGNKIVPAPTLIIEPGRSIIARAGVALYRVGARKPTPGGITYLFVDGGMADNIRPALYSAHYTALPVEQLSTPEEEVCISGRYCESGDMLIERVTLPQMQEGNLLLLPTTGAYCLPMASNYNLVPRPAVILIEEQQVWQMERRETYADLLMRYTRL